MLHCQLFFSMLWFYLATHFVACCGLPDFLCYEMSVQLCSFGWLIMHRYSKLNNYQRSFDSLSSSPKVNFAWTCVILVSWSDVRLPLNFLCMLFHLAVDFLDQWFCASRFIMFISWLHADRDQSCRLSVCSLWLLLLGNLNWCISHGDLVVLAPKYIWIVMTSLANCMSKSKQLLTCTKFFFILACSDFVLFLLLLGCSSEAPVIMCTVHCVTILAFLRAVRVSSTCWVVF